ncbi:ABC transporter substrate-binding protein [Streptomyces sp. ACA25]|uniref:ABC transporter substrate-binding protein n=1 Tax=Streptomyces sp. ACA25 TaxID=3022596 RepID=UPI002308089E|nr:ABC transporter substrate-binding protein [Streptomyces sp. ACA25]MDB1087956.1 ABC transporter substrate-binding protein [Streptomyces sp. ACA25]
MRTRTPRTRSGRAAPRHGRPAVRPGTALALALALTATAATGCGAEIAAEETAGPGPSGHYPVTVENCGEELTFDRAPERVLTNDAGITEIMFALGLTDHMVGYAVLPDDRASSTDVPWGDGYEKTEWLAKDRISKELILDAGADLVFAGWNYGFGETTGVTPDALRELGIGSWVLTESCRTGEGSARGVMPPLEALYTDLAALGTVFDVEDRAAELIAEFRQEVEEAQALAPSGSDRPRVFLYDDGRDKPLTSGRYAGPHDIITRAGGDHVMADLADSWVTVGWETVVERDPEVIVINDYGATTAAQKEKFLKSYGPLSEVSAIKHDRVFVLNYVDLVESPRNPAAVTALAAYLRDLR